MDPERRRYILENLGAFPDLSSLRRSSFFAECGKEIEATLETPRISRIPEATPRLTSFIRVVQWNIERGQKPRQVVEKLLEDPILSQADVVLLNEVDLGTDRSGNVDVAATVAAALGMHAVFGAAHFELTRGAGEEFDRTGACAESLQGNAVLTRYPVLEACVVRLPVCFEPYEFHEKRYGTRNCVWARLQVAERRFWVGAVHLEVRNTPRCRARQMTHLLDRPPGAGLDACLLGGDLNSNGFPRGTLWRTIRSVARLVLREPRRLRSELCHPELHREPLFAVARRRGWTWTGMNSPEATTCARIGDLEDADLLPGWVVSRVRRRLSPHEGYLWFKLDWLLGRNVRGLRDGELVDARGEVSRAAGVRPMELRGPGRISDHAPIWADIVLS